MGVRSFCHPRHELPQDVSHMINDSKKTLFLGDNDNFFM